VYVLRSPATTAASFPAGALLLDSLQQVPLGAG
jgi:predicted benzoate:H+ symporter BenE